MSIKPPTRLAAMYVETDELIESLGWAEIYRRYAEKSQKDWNNMTLPEAVELLRSDPNAPDVSDQSESLPKQAGRPKDDKGPADDLAEYEKGIADRRWKSQQGMATAKGLKASTLNKRLKRAREEKKRK